MSVNALRLIKDIDEQINNWDEISQFKMRGINNLSLSDLEQLRFYAEEYVRSKNFGSFIEPMGDIKRVLEEYGLSQNKIGLFY